ncbi:DUF317 domain-containing protein [Streptomyces sp. NPDC001739]
MRSHTPQRRRPRPPWFVRTTVPQPGRRLLWSAYFSGETPAHLIAAFAAALADPAPLPRAATSIPFGCTQTVTATSEATWLSDTQLNKRITTRTTAVRNAARRARRAAAAQSSTPSTPPPGQLPAPRRAR